MRRTLQVGRWCRTAGYLAPLLLLPVLTGCGGGTGTVSGEVTYQGKPVRGGWVTFVPKDPKVSLVQAKIEESGHYELSIPAGEVRISVDNRELKPAPATGGGLPPDLLAKLPKKGEAQPKAQPKRSTQLAGEYREIPSKYYQVESSGLTYTVTAGSQKKDIELK